MIFADLSLQDTLLSQMNDAHQYQARLIKLSERVG